MSRIAYEQVWQSVDANTRDELVAFWNRHGAIRDEQVARSRATQVVAVARAESGELAGVCTVDQRTPPDLGHSVYFYRTFVAQPYRGSMIMVRLLRMAVETLESHSLSHPDTAAKGIYLELENPLFATKYRRAVWRRTGPFVYIGKTAKGLERRLLWFKHSRI